MGKHSDDPQAAENQSVSARKFNRLGAELGSLADRRLVKHDLGFGIVTSMNALLPALSRMSRDAHRASGVAI